MSVSNLSQFDINSSDKVLFLGEGNFSFSHCLLKQLKDKFEAFDFSNVYVSCFEKELSPDAFVNVNFLRSIGAEVLLAVDATKLEVSPTISSLKFNKVIFNFPHVGGKMKIHLNRKLLRDFFISASKILSPLGTITVSLCSGQGGTEFDIVVRRYDDTWQIVEQAANSGFILVEVDLFSRSLLPSYKPVGYRGREQEFSTGYGVIHCFRKESPILNCLNESSLTDIQDFHHFSNELLVPYIHKFTMLFDPFIHKDSPQSFLLASFLQLLQNHSMNVLIKSDLPYTSPFNLFGAACLLNGKKLCLRSSLKEVVCEVETEYFLAYGLVFKKCSADFSDFCTRCQLLVKCPLSIVKTFVSSVISRFNFSGHIDEEVCIEDHWNLYFQNENLSRNKVAWGRLSEQLVTIDLDLMCSYIFNISIKQLWCAELKLDKGNFLKFPSLYSLRFVFDISFAVKKELDFDSFYYILHNLPENIIESVNLVDIHNLLETEEISYCFRLSYRSYTKPLSKQSAIQFHKRIVGEALVKLLDARIR